MLEIHRSPVVASKIMEENPRQFVTLPDVFRYPWIVVWPESMLMPGEVFNIVPCHTLYRLVREGRRLANHRPPPQQSAVMAVDSGVRAFDERYKPAGAKSCLKKKSRNVSEASLGRRLAFILSDNRMMVVGGGE